MKILFVDEELGNSQKKKCFDRRFLERLLQEGYGVDIFSFCSKETKRIAEEGYIYDMSRHSSLATSLALLFRIVFVRYDVIDFQEKIGLWKFLAVKIVHPTCSIIIHKATSKNPLSFSEKFLLRHVDQVVVPSRNIKTILRKKGIKNSVVIPGYRSFEKSYEKNIYLFGDSLVKEKQYITLSFSQKSNVDAFVKVLRSYEKMLKTNRISNNIAFVALLSHTTKEQDLLLYTLALSQPLFFVHKANSYDEKRGIIGKSLLFVGFQETPEREKEDAIGFGVPVLYAGEKQTRKTNIFSSIVSYRALCEELSYIFNASQREMQEIMEKEKKRVQRKFRFSNYVNKNRDLYQECIASKRVGKLSWSALPTDHS